MRSHVFNYLTSVVTSATHTRTPALFFFLYFFFFFFPDGLRLLFARFWAGEMRGSGRPPVWLQAGGQGSLCRQHGVVQLWPGLHPERSRGSHLPAGGEKDVGQPPPSLLWWVGFGLFVCETERVCANFFIQLQLRFLSRAALASAASKHLEINENQNSKGSRVQDAK